MRKLIGYYNYTVILTYLGLCSGAFGILLICGQISTFGAVICLLIAGLCDAFDGKVAGTRQRSAEEKRFGIQIDSLSDIICFGVLPACICFSAGMKYIWCYAIPVLYILCTLIRLAFYNVTEEERQDSASGSRKYYLGLPVTSAAVIFPILFLLCKIIGDILNGYEYILYSLTALVTAVAFVLPFRVKKLKMLGIIVLVLMGVGIAAALFIMFMMK